MWLNCIRCIDWTNSRLLIIPLPRIRGGLLGGMNARWFIAEICKFIIILCTFSGTLDSWRMMSKINELNKLKCCPAPDHCTRFLYNNAELQICTSKFILCFFSFSFSLRLALCFLSPSSPWNDDSMKMHLPRIYFDECALCNVCMIFTLRGTSRSSWAASPMRFLLHLFSIEIVKRRNAIEETSGDRHIANYYYDSTRLSATQSRCLSCCVISVCPIISSSANICNKYRAPHTEQMLDLYTNLIASRQFMLLLWSSLLLRCAWRNRRTDETAA